jgi:type III secretion system YscQ/HrcQ family protein
MRVPEDGGSDAARSVARLPWRVPALRRLRRPAMGVANWLCNRQAWRLDWFGVPAQVCIAGVEWIDDVDALFPVHELLVRATWRGMAGYLGASHLAAEAALSGHLETVPWHLLPPAMATALLQDGADRLAASNPALGAMRFQTMAPGAALPRVLCAVRLRVTPVDNGEVIDLHWLAEPGALEQTLSSLAKSGPLRHALDRDLLMEWGQLPVALAFELGWVHLPLNDLQGLRTEDVLLPDGWWAEHENGRVGLRVGALTGWDMGCTGVLVEAGQRIKVTGWQKMERDLPEDVLSAFGPGADFADVERPSGNVQDQGYTNAGAASWGPSALGDLPVRLTFDLGERSLTLQELADVGAGYVFDLGLSPRNSVTLRVNGLRVGEGEIVEIDGRLGVAVTRILPPRA